MDNILLVASKNKHKIEEIGKILAPAGIDVRSAYDYIIDMGDIEETGVTFAENAELKANAISALVDEPVIADDSGICVDALNGAPGVYSARYSGPDADDQSNNELLLHELANVEDKDRTAAFMCVIALAVEGETIAFFEGKCEGKIGYEPKGENGFGFDPLFVLDDGRTMAELAPEDKNKISHRFRALNGLLEYFNEQD